MANHQIAIHYTLSQNPFYTYILQIGEHLVTHLTKMPFDRFYFVGIRHTILRKYSVFH